MEEHSKFRRLKKLSETSIEIIESESENSLRDNEKNSDSMPNSENESSEPEISKNKTKKSKPAKNKAPKLQIFNKMLDLKAIPEDFSVTEFEYLRDAPLEITSKKQKVKKTSFLNKATKKTQDKSSYSLAKSVLTNKSENDTLIVNAPIKIDGFFTKVQTLNPREIFRDKLKTEINERKTTHIGNDYIFDKSISDLTSKEEIIEKYDTSANKQVKIDEIIKLDSNENSKKIEILRENEKKITKNENNKEKKIKSYPSTSASSPIYEPRENSRSNKFIENEAEESGNEVVERSEDELDNSEQILEDLIDDKKIKENREETYSKHVKEMLEKEYKELNMVVNGNFKRRNPEESLLGKKTQKIQETMKLIKKPQVFSKAAEGSESDEDLKFKYLNEARNIRNIRNTYENNIIIDEKSNDYLKLIEKPEIMRCHKTLLNLESSKSNSIPLNNDPKGGISYFKVMKPENTIESLSKGKIKNKSKLLSLLRK